MIGEGLSLAPMKPHEIGDELGMVQQGEARMSDGSRGASTSAP